jgi:membrane protease YdiL (CAAX protease family)
LNNGLRSHYPLTPVNWLFLLLAGAFLTLGSMAQAANFELGILFTEYGLLIVPLLLLGLFFRVDLKRSLRLNRLPVKVGLKIAGATLLMIPLVAFLNVTVIAVLTTFFEYIPPTAPEPSQGTGFLITFFVMAITPGICEELFFRGMVMNAFEGRFGYRFAALLSALLFGIFHFNLANFLGPILLGVLFAWLVQVTGSIFAGMVGHAVNNGFAVILSYLITRGQGVAMETGPDLTELFLENKDMLMASLFGAAGLLLLLAVPFAFMGLAIYRNIRLDYLKSGDRLKVSGQQFVVTGGSGSKVYLYPYDVIPAEEDYQEAIRFVDLKALRRDRTVRMVSKHWERAERPVMKFKDSLPLLLTGVLYIGIGIYLLLMFRGLFS